MSILIDTDTRPICPCCEGSGGHGYRASAIGVTNPADDDEGCTNCGEKGRTYFTDARPNSCSGYRELMKRVNR